MPNGEEGRDGDGGDSGGGDWNKRYYFMIQNTKCILLHASFPW